MKPATIDRYILLQFLPYFLISAALFSFIFVANQLLDITDYIVNYGIGISTVTLMLAYSFPYFLEYVIPISTMIAILFVFLEMSADNEIVALKAAGVSIYRLLFPVLVFGFCTAALTAVMAVYGLPWGSLGFKQQVYKAISAGFNMGIVEREFNNSFPGVMLYVGEMDQDTRQLTDVLVEDTRTKDTSITISAPSGRFAFDFHGRRFSLFLENGLINQVDVKAATVNTIRFETYEVNFDLGGRAQAAVGSKDEKEMWPAELIDYLKTAPKNSEDYLSAKLEFYKKGAIPFACLVLGLLALPLGLQTRSRKKSSGVGVALVCFLVYYVLLSTGETMAETGTLSPFLAAWLPNLIMAAVAVWLVAAAARDRTWKDDLARFFR